MLAPDWSASAPSVRPATPFPTDSLAAERFPVLARSHWPHNGVLFLDELPEFPRNVLEVMRQPLEDETVCIARASMSLTFPARFMLAEAMNPCPCGYFNDRSRECRCTPPVIQRYMSKISGPLLDRIDIHIDVPAVNEKGVGFGRRTGKPPPRFANGSCELADRS
jgi:predicted ATPase with chaperone activity